MIFLINKVWQIGFHPTAPHNLISCSEDGDVLLWSALPPSHAVMQLFISFLDFATKGAFEPDAQSLTLHKLAHHDLSVNSFDINPETNTLVCGTDILFPSNLLHVSLCCSFTRCYIVRLSSLPSQFCRKQFAARKNKRGILAFFFFLLIGNSVHAACLQPSAESFLLVGSTLTQ